MRIAAIDHSYHATTRSTDFFYELLSKIGSVQRFHDETWCGGKNEWRRNFRESDYDLIIIWQVYEAFSALSGRHDNVLFVPMYDAMFMGPDFENFYWKRQFGQAKCLSFCRKLHQEIASRNGTSRYFKYFPDPADYAVASDFDEMRPFFWYRRSKINAEIIFELCRNTEIKNLVIHNAPDPGEEPLCVQSLPKNILNYEMTTWFKSAADYRKTLVQNNLFFAPRPVEGIGMAFLEAMASGLCVVAPNLPTMSEYIADGTNGMLYSFEQRWPLHFARAREIGARARETVERGFADWQHALPELVDFIVTPKSRLKMKSFPSVKYRPEPVGAPSAAPRAKISVVTVCYNAAEHLESTIENVLGQDLPDVEYIILDGASTDASVAIIEKYAYRLAHWQSEPDQGVYHAMNKAVAHCTGEWVLFMNAGDAFSDPHSLSRMFRKIPNDTDIVYGHHYYVPVGGTPEYHAAADFETTWDRLQRGELRSDWLAGIPAHQATAVRRSLLEKLKFDTTFQIAADHDLLFRARQGGAKFFNCDEIVSIYAGGGMSARNRGLCKQEWIQVGRKYGDSAAVDRFYAQLEHSERRPRFNLWRFLHHWTEQIFGARKLRA
ncbi:MAG: glycosyltransferase [Methylovirgula sp.]